MNKKSKAVSDRHFPPVYEKLIPIGLAILILGVLVLLGIIVAVLIGAFPLK